MRRITQSLVTLSAEDRVLMVRRTLERNDRIDMEGAGRAASGA